MTALRPKAARFNKLSNDVERTTKVDHEGHEEEVYERVHMSFQLTSPCNISTVNALNTCAHSHVTEKREDVDLTSDIRQ
jgi:hypothetical protein